MRALAEIVRRLERIERLLRELVEDFRGLKIAFERTFGTWGTVVGRTAEYLLRRVLEEVARRGGVEVDGVRIPPLSNLRKLISPGRYEFDIVGEDERGRMWLIEVKYRFVFKRDASKFISRVERWYAETRRPFVACMVALVGVEEGVEAVLESGARKLGGEALLIRPRLALKLIRLVEPNIEVYVSEEEKVENNRT